jgi:hypothetical protein
MSEQGGEALSALEEEACSERQAVALVCPAKKAVVLWALRVVAYSEQEATAVRSERQVVA